MGEINYMDEFINAIREEMSYDYMARNGYNFTKDELIRISLELIYEITEKNPDIENVANELEEFYAE